MAFAIACGVFNVAFELAYAALLPRLVSADDLLVANSRIAAGQAVVETASVGIGGGWVQRLGAPLAVLADALSFTISPGLIWRAPVATEASAWGCSLESARPPEAIDAARRRG